jgi:hypothetical protein
MLDHSEHEIETVELHHTAKRYHGTEQGTKGVNQLNSRESMIIPVLLWSPASSVITFIGREHDNR